MTVVLESAIDVDESVTGFASDGGDLLYTVGGDVMADAKERPRMRHDRVRLSLSTRVAAPTVRAPDHEIAARGGLVFPPDCKIDGANDRARRSARGCKRRRRSDHAFTRGNQEEPEWTSPYCFGVES